MGVGKSKLATITINTLYRNKPRQAIKPFRSGCGAAGVTHGVWMWADPLPHPSGEGSVMLLDCEGMGDINEHLGANLYLFCMIISTSFAIVLRPPRIQRAQCDRLYHALLRFEKMKSSHVLPNLWLIPELREYVRDDRDHGETVISKEKWLKLVFSYNNENNSTRLGEADALTLQSRFDTINRMLPKRDVAKLNRLPDSLADDAKDLDVWSLLREENSETYFNSVKSLLDQLLSTGGKVLPGSGNERLYIRPSELASFMSELVKAINNDKMPNPDSLVERYLRARFENEIVEVQIAAFNAELFAHAQELCQTIEERQRLETDEEISELNEKMGNVRHNLTENYLGKIIQLTRYEIFGLDKKKVTKDFRSSNEKEAAAKQLPTSIQIELIEVERTMNKYQKGEELIEETRTNMKSN
ncbi:unnamed protein product [Rotaria sordida]|uniref:Guanylate-binding protein N-terminal domain-containing protein n=1 Tax=Rotaria sordida TaxID=392033 RepID=A0A814LMB6_9BILA|nr:unnamed protein product [Rotaria sordida]CAF1075966.1 unnamed protein product [Rotaria sordida]CAF3769967.1 unnamed protein product [Rotaria sordida]CAF3901972.1 unnamed protein product [Rotaria sordida]